MSDESKYVLSSLDELRGYIYHRLKGEWGFDEMYDVFISGEAIKRFWIYEIQLESGEVELTIDYSLMNGGGWLNVGMPFNKFCESIEAIIKNWPMTDELIGILTKELQLLKEHADKMRKET